MTAEKKEVQKKGTVYEFETKGTKDKVQALVAQTCSTSVGGDVYHLDRILACEDVSDPNTRYWALRIETETGWLNQSRIDSLVSKITGKDGGFVLGKDEKKSNEAISSFN